ncbi:cobyric acid synthase [Butyrivibrio sp. JL13D10]|uniref:cobyric acid synthase n=1 Tax=Butyrivibrio sp. JL13D10 TaxID=3236815 RepID=UPI0038B47A13
MSKNLMIQGTMSGAGKSILTAGILRVLRQDGYRVAPFKSQNMALNSFVTRDGKEIGRAQAVQARAAQIEPSSDMNPILLKPMGDTTSQVIVNGVPIGNMRAADYFRMKKQLIPDIISAYDRLSKETDIIVIEGAGSPVEINLRENDIVNMGLAQMLDAPVLLAGNIDPGGVFAQLLGTVNLMSDEERKRVKGLIINKFRGDVSLLKPGLSMFYEYCKIPFAGIVPYVNLDLEEEDSISERLENKIARGSEEEIIRIAVVRLPYISNYSDFSILQRIPGVSLIYTKRADDIKNADMIIIPGTKNTLKDMNWLRESGLADEIIKASYGKALVVGICGGLQMLGEKIDDKDFLEGGGNCNGLGLLPITTTFNHEKMLRQTKGIIAGLTDDYVSLNGLDISGYEIHMGTSDMDEKKLPIMNKENVFGTYIHGIFDSAKACRKLLEIICEKKGLKDVTFDIEDEASHQEKELDRLADVLRDSLDFDLIYEAIGI